MAEALADRLFALGNLLASTVGRVIVFRILAP